MFRAFIRAATLSAFLLIGAVPHSDAQAGQEQAAQGNGAKTAEGGENENPDAKWHLINTGIFAVGLGWAIWKLAPGFFNARSADIQKAIREATGLKMEADLRYSEIDRKMATLPEEVNKLKEQARIEMEREHQRRRDETTRELKRIHDAGTAEIEGISQQGIRQIRQHTAELALQLAERRLAERVNQTSNDELLQDFIHLVERGKN